MYRATCRLHLPVTEVVKERGDTVTVQELQDAEQTEEDVQNLTEALTLVPEAQWEHFLEAEKVVEAEEAKQREITTLRGRLQELEGGQS